MKIRSLFSLRKWIAYYLGKPSAKKMSDEKYIKLKFYASLGRKLNLDNPKTFNEKLQWLKLYDRKPEYTIMVDKYEAKKYVADIIGEEYIIPTLGVWDSFDEIDFDKLPEKFVLKCTHDSGGLVICRDKKSLDIGAARAKIERSLARNYYLHGREWPYKNVPRKIIAEKFMEDEETAELRDYKFFCFNGDVKIILVCAERFSDGGLRENFYDTNWNLLPFERPLHHNTEYPIKAPQNFKKMIQAAEKLSKDIPFSRIDFYETNGKMYFGEITFFPASGFEGFEPAEWDEKFGEWIKLPDKTV